MQVTAVVVTFNRLSLLQGLLERLSSISGVGDILVVDNASSDGTSEWLEQSAPQGVRSRTLSTNTGGAGGFHEGVGWAIAETDADLIWLMDNDGMPEPDCLERLLDHQDRLDFWGPVVVDEKAPEQLVFPIRLPGGTRVIRTTSDVRRDVIDDVVIPFNGVLVTRELVEEIGLPRAEYFIWGDDHEYRLRAQAAGATVATVTGARVLHPRVGDLGTSMMFGATTYNHSSSNLKHYCMARNNLLNLRNYHGWAHALAFVAKTVWFYSFTRPSPRRLTISLRAMVAGLRGDFTGHRRYL